MPVHDSGAGAPHRDDEPAAIPCAARFSETIMQECRYTVCRPVQTTSYKTVNETCYQTVTETACREVCEKVCVPRTICKPVTRTVNETVVQQLYVPGKSVCINGCLYECPGTWCEKTSLLPAHGDRERHVHGL